MKNLFEYLSKEGAIGAAAAASETWTAYMEGFKDVVPKLAEAIGGMPGSGGFFDQIKKEVSGMYQNIFKYLNDPKFLDGIRRVFEPVFKVVLFVIKQISAAVDWLGKTIKNNPDSLRWAGHLAAGFVAIAAVIGPLLVALGTLAGLVGSVLAMTGVAAAVKGIIMAIAMAVQIIITLVSVIGTIKSAYENNFGGFKSFIEGVSVAFTGLVEVIENWRDGMSEISEGTYEQLEKIGIAKWVIGIGGWIAKVLNWFGKVYDFVMSKWPDIVDAFEPLSNAFKDLGEQVGSVFGDIAESFGMTNGAASSELGPIEFIINAIILAIRIWLS